MKYDFTIVFTKKKNQFRIKIAFSVNFNVIGLQLHSGGLA